MKIVFVSLIALAALALAIRILNGPRVEAQPPSKSSTPIEVGSVPLSIEGFWALIDHSAALEADPDAQIADLRASLDRLTHHQIADFERLFHETMRNSYTWDLWGAAYLSNGGASDDGFEYFRCWLISKGRRVFEAVSADPDSLADLLAPGPGGDLEFEDFAYVARDAWAAKTGRDWNEMPVIADMAYGNEPTGSRLIESPEALTQRYPKLWKRFGH